MIATEHVPGTKVTLERPGAGALPAARRYPPAEAAQGLAINPNSATYFFSREMVITGGNTGMWGWEKGFYSLIVRNARPAKDYCNISPSQIIEIGLPIQL
jgi:K+ transporter